MEAISYKLDVFEGPLDLLLHLISKHKIDINDIPILLLVEQYLDYVRQMKEEDMEVASEFLEMAARLVYIKSVMLLPRYEEETEDFKRELTGQLIEYQLCQQQRATEQPVQNRRLPLDEFLTAEINGSATENRDHDKRHPQGRLDFNNR